MKPLIVTIVIAIMATSITGCTFVSEHYRGRPRHVAIVTNPRHLPTGPGNPHYPHPHRDVSRRPYPRFRHWRY